MISLILMPIGSFVLGAVLGTGMKKKKRESYQLRFIDSDKIENIVSEGKIIIESGAACSVCGDKITVENLGIFAQKKGKNNYVCKKSHCLKFNKLTTVPYSQSAGRDK